MDLEIYEAYKHVFEDNGLTREGDAPDATGPSAKFHALATNLYASFSEKEKTRLEGRAKMLLRLDLQKMVGSQIAYFSSVKYSIYTCNIILTLLCCCLLVSPAQP
jgi:hypothetical protein